MNPEAEIKAFVATERQGIVRMLSDLVAIPTVNPPGHAYREMVDFLSGVLTAWNIEHRVITVPHGHHPRYSIIASLGAGESGLHFHGHYDVVSAESDDQFHAVQHDGRLYGRGTADMKGGIVAMLFAMRAIQQAGAKLSKRLTLTLVPDEETGGRLGMRYLAAEQLLPAPQFGALMPEPSGGAIWNGCRGALTVQIRVTGKATHGAIPQPAPNAFEAMVGIVNDVVALKQRVVARRTSLPTTPVEAANSVMLVGGASGSGVDSNVVPASAWFSIERRFNPEETLALVKGELDEIVDRHRAKGVNVEVETLQESEACMSPPDAPIGRVLAAVLEDVTGKPARFELCPGVLETRFFCQRGVAGFGYGPGLLAVSHGPDEYVGLQELFDCTAAYALTAARLLA
jgi:acetylornithine deacetylase/succinyl-diaminopimelate desuccinylase family protein